MLVDFEQNMSRKSLTILVGVLGMLRALKWSYWNSHWMAKGSSYYGDHILFERLYGEGIDVQIDTLAEKIVSYDQDILMGNMMQDAFVSLVDFGKKKVLEKNNLALGMLVMEKRFQSALLSAYNSLKSNNELTLGMDDFLMSMANERETASYLLGQRLRQ